MCELLEEPADGFLVVNGLTVNDTTLYFCDSGFEANGPVRRRCRPTGEWSGNETVCDRKSCAYIVDWVWRLICIF